MEEKKEVKEFNEWAIVELTGHQKVVGRVSEKNFGSTCFFQVDVLDKAGKDFRFSRLVNASSVYALNPVSEPVCREYAKAVCQYPIVQLDARKLLPSQDKAHFCGCDDLFETEDE